MKFEFSNNRDFWAGVVFMGIGAVAIAIASDYPFGSTLRMGPGYFPSVLGGILIVFGICIMVKGLLRNDKIKGRWSRRGLIVVSLSMVMFGILMKYVGFIPALVVLIFGSAAAGKSFKFIEVLLLTMFLTGLSVAVFIWGLGLPYPLIKGF